MSLPLNAREWVGLDEAVHMAIQVGVFPNITSKPNFGDIDYSEARRQIILAYMEAGGEMRPSSEHKSIWLFQPQNAEDGHPVTIRPTGDYQHCKWPCSNGYVEEANGRSLLIHYSPYMGIVLEDALLVEDPYGINFLHVRPTVPAYSIKQTHYGIEFSVIRWRDIAYLPTYDDKNFIEIKRELLNDIFSEAKLLASTATNPLQATAVSLKEDLPPRTAGAIYKEYKAMAIAIAHLAQKKYTSNSELAEIVMNACAAADHAMPVEKRTVLVRLERC